MNSGTVDLIATDPPFNKSRDFHATPDSLASGASFQDRWRWRDDVHDEWLETLQRDEPEVWQVISAAKAVHSEAMGAFLCWLGVRLLEMHRVLADNGSLYLHIDHTAHAWVKCLLDAIFGRENFRNEIVWCYAGGGVPRHDFPRKHDTLLRYTKSAECVFNTIYRDYSDGTLQRGRTAIKGKYFDQGLRNEGTPINDWWTDVPKITSPTDPEKKAAGYPTQKPLALYERLIQVSSNPGDMVLDPFAGCATTCIAAERLGRKWVGIDIWKGALDLVRSRLEANKQLLVDANPQVLFSTTPPARTDAGEMAAVVFRTPLGRARERHPAPRTQHGKLVEDIGPLCQGCGADYTFDARVLEVDHIRPRSDGGSNAYDNLTLLCPPCNKEKRDYYTLSALQDRNRTNGYMKNEGNLRIGRVAQRRVRRRRR